MRRISLLVLAVLFFVANLCAQDKAIKQVATAVEQLRSAMIDADSLTLTNILSDQLSYGHSHGNVENKQQFMLGLLSGRSDFISIDLSAQTIFIKGNTAIVRHTLDAKTQDSGKPAEVHLKILLVWFKEKGGWKLLARQAVAQ